MPKSEISREDVQAVLLNQLVMVNNLYYAHDDERERMIVLCKKYGISATKIRRAIQRP